MVYVFVLKIIESLWSCVHLYTLDYFLMTNFKEELLAHKPNSLYIVKLNIQSFAVIYSVHFYWCLNYKICAI